MTVIKVGVCFLQFADKGAADSSKGGKRADIGGPSPRFGSALTMRQGVLYLFGGMVEDDEDRQLTFKDFYSLGKAPDVTCYCPSLTTNFA